MKDFKNKNTVARIFITQGLLKKMLKLKRSLEKDGYEVDDILLASAVNMLQYRIILNQRYEKLKLLKQK